MNKKQIKKILNKAKKLAKTKTKDQLFLILGKIYEKERKDKRNDTN